MVDRICCVEGCTKPAARKNRECSMHRSRLAAHGSYELPPKPLKRKSPPPRPPKPKVECKAEGCIKFTVSHGLCSTHESRLRRTGTYADRVLVVNPRMHTDGYWEVPVDGAERIIAGKRTLIYEHRKEMFHHIGYGPHRCHWCETHINWRTGLEVDHLDYNRANNNLDNLVPSCHGCNSRRARHANKYGPMGKNHTNESAA